MRGNAAAHGRIQEGPSAVSSSSSLADAGVVVVVVVASITFSQLQNGTLAAVDLVVVVAVVDLDKR
jgi:hypothetical protein